MDWGWWWCYPCKCIQGKPELSMLLDLRKRFMICRLGVFAKCSRLCYSTFWRKPIFFLNTWIIFSSHILLWQVIEAGANALVAGSAVFGAKSYSEGMLNMDYLTSVHITRFIFRGVLYRLYLGLMPLCFCVPFFDSNQGYQGKQETSGGCCCCLECF